MSNYSVRLKDFATARKIAEKAVFKHVKRLIVPDKFQLLIRCSDLDYDALVFKIKEFKTLVE